MSLIRIVANDIELDFVKETLTVKKENNAMIRNFKVSHSTFPFLIIENKKAKEALGTRDLTSVDKIKTITVKVFENDVEFYGELQIMSYLKGYRKCNLKYASPLLEIMNKKISEFMPVVSVTGATTGIPPFAEQSDSIFSGDDDWPTYAQSFITQGFPAVKWNFPMMNWKDKYGEDLPTDNEWFNYKNFVNAFDDNGNYLLNTLIQEEDFNFTISNLNVPMPQIYLLSPLFYALESIGFTISGNFALNSFIQKIMFLSFKNNLCKILPTLPPESIILSPLNPFALSSIYYIANFEIIADTIGTYIVKYRFVEPLYPAPGSTFKSFKIKFDGATAGYVHQRGQQSKIYEEKIEISVSESQLGLPIRFTYITPLNSMPTYQISVELQTQNAFYQMHPTISLGRYLPDWTFGSYLNNIKNLFNLDLDPDDLTKKLNLNFNEDWIVNQQPEILKKSMIIKSYEQNPYEAFLLKYENEEDEALWITSSGSVKYTDQKSEFSQELNTKFKYIPLNQFTSELSDSLEEKEGVGLMIYDEIFFPNNSYSYDNKTLNINDAGGIYDIFWKKFLKFRLNASLIEVQGGFTKTEIGKFIKTKRIYFDKQDYVVSVLEYKELKKDNYLVNFRLESVTI